MITIEQLQKIGRFNLVCEVSSRGMAPHHAQQVVEQLDPLIYAVAAMITAACDRVKSLVDEGNDDCG